MTNFYSPLEQFEIWPIWGFLYFFDNNAKLLSFFVFTNLDLTFFVGIIELFFFSVLFYFTYWWVGGVLLKWFYFFFSGILNLIIATVGSFSFLHFGIVVTLFLFISLFDLLGLIPFGFCTTSHIVVTQLLGFFTVGGLTLKGLYTLGWRWFNLFIPRNVPSLMLPFLSIIEIISYVSRALSLSIRLFANMVAGHALLHILIGALLNLLSLPVSTFLISGFFILPTILLLAITSLELGIAVLQAYVFVVLYLIYLNDAVKSH